MLCTVDRDGVLNPTRKIETLFKSRIVYLGIKQSLACSFIIRIKIRHLKAEKRDGKALEDSIANGLEIRGLKQRNRSSRTENSIFFVEKAYPNVGN